MLYMHGEQLLTHKQLHAIPVPPREAVEGRTERWVGINHGDLADAVTKQLKAAKIKILNEGWYCNPKGTHLWGAVDMEIPDRPMLKLNIGQGANFSLGVRHSNVGAYAVSFAVGARVQVCSNGLFDGQYLLKHRHTESLKLDELIKEGIQRYLKEAEQLEGFIYGLQDTQITDDEAARIILDSKEKGEVAGYVNWAHLEKVWDAWKTPPHEEFKPRNAWSLYNSFTQMGKELSPPRQLKMLTGMRPVFADLIGEGGAASKN